jgi:hypothetical protein
MQQISYSNNLYGTNKTQSIPHSSIKKKMRRPNQGRGATAAKEGLIWLGNAAM